MTHVPMVFKFRDHKSASLAYGTLTELGYHTHHNVRNGQSVVEVYIDHSELTSALEITQAYGGELSVEPLVQQQLVENELNMQMGNGFTSDEHVYQSAYDMDTIPIPAHLVNEDGGAEYGGSQDISGTEESFDPSGNEYDGFEAGVHL